jgi:hypothetical protein
VSRLRSTERDNLVVDVDTSPPLSGTAKATFDGGDTWIDGTAVAGGWAWAIHGPDFDPAAVDQDPGGVEITADTLVRVIVADDPVAVVREVTIRLVD